MTKNSRYIRLSVGVSALALIVASPALAQAVVSPGLDVDPVFVITADQVLTLGVTDAGTPAATAVVASTATGTIVQRLSVGEEEPVPLAPAAAPGDLDAIISIDNAGTVSIKALATATNDEGHAVANADLVDAVTQIATAPNATVSASLVNSGLFDLGASASATGTDFPGDIAARATASAIGGLHQEATVEGGGGGSASTSMINSGTILFNGTATANAVGDALARATAGEALFMRAQANGGGDGVTSTTFSNSGTLTAGAAALATSSAGAATAESTLGGGEHGLFHLRTASNGSGDDSSTVTVTNAAAGRITGTSIATANGTTIADSNAVADSLLVTKVQSNGQDGGLSIATVTNNGRINFGATSVASALAEGSRSGAIATIGSAILQVAEAEGSPQIENRTAAVTLTNSASGVINVIGSASATGDLANASSQLDPAVLQQATTTGAASAAFTNGGSFLASSSASATGLTGTAQAGAVGVEQEVTGNTALATFANTGTFTVQSIAGVFGETSGSALASAIGYTAFGDPLTLAVTNSGAVVVTADAQVAGPATAGALGLGFYGTYDPTVVVEGEEGGGHGGTEGHGGPTNGGHGTGEGGPVIWEEEAANSLSGAVTNSGSLTVTASATGSILMDAPVPGLALPAAPADLPVGATAVGLDFESAVNTATLTNTGAIIVSARTNVGVASATGILVRDFDASPILPPEGAVFTIINDGGTITARESTDGGLTWTHGLAIDTILAPNAVAIRLLGGGSIYGNVDISADDSITITGGTTTLDGLINPNGEFEGSLTIASGGALHLVDSRTANPSYDGPAGGYVNTFTVASGGTLVLDMPLSFGGSGAPLGSVGALAIPSPIQVIAANTVTLAGTLQLNLSTSNGLFENFYSIDNIIDANALNGTFSSVVTNTGSPLLVPVAVYDSGANVDLTITRIGFGAVSGLTGNQGAVGGGIEAVYSPTLTGPFASLLSNLFLLDATDYPLALDQLTGAQTAGYLQSLRNSSQQLNTAIADQSDCLSSPEGIESCRNPETGFRLWMAGGLTSANLDGDANAPGSDAKQQFAIVGLDHVMDKVRVGGYVGYRDLEVDFDRQNGRINADGWLIGLRAAYDTGDYYLRGVGSFTKLSGSSIRSIGILSTAGTAAGTPDTGTLSLYAEAGARFPVQGTWLTPFIALDHAGSELSAFTETGVPGANLAYSDQSVSQTSLLAGLKWTGRMGSFIPEARIAYRSDLGDSAFDVTARFADAPAGSAFTVQSPVVDRGSFLAGLSLTGAFSDRVSGRIGYTGRFGSGIDDQAVYGSVTIRFGAGAR
ncbi:MAG: hypothetical protein ACI9YM_001178 [Brevundimonas sp.]|jgi:uncharacterized protein with beta-barrel porin domain|uniref:autotransporter domain-containing protein n=1 Tax=Brevundimonas sp. TaxID=1871086 RepID=UPI0039E24A0E